MELAYRKGYTIFQVWLNKTTNVTSLVYNEPIQRILSEMHSESTNSEEMPLSMVCSPYTLYVLQLAYSERRQTGPEHVYELAMHLDLLNTR